MLTRIDKHGVPSIVQKIYLDKIGMYIVGEMFDGYTLKIEYTKASKDLLCGANYLWIERYSDKWFERLNRYLGDFYIKNYVRNSSHTRRIMDRGISNGKLL